MVFIGHRKPPQRTCTIYFEITCNKGKIKSNKLNYIPSGALSLSYPHQSSGEDLQGQWGPWGWNPWGPWSRARASKGFCWSSLASTFEKRSGCVRCAGICSSSQPPPSSPFQPATLPLCLKTLLPGCTRLLTTLNSLLTANPPSWPLSLRLPPLLSFARVHLTLRWGSLL